MLRRTIDSLRVLGHRALSTRKGDEYKPVRVGLEILNIANELVGRPFCSEAELMEARTTSTVSAPRAPIAREPAPVMVYFDNRDHRTMHKVEEALKASSIPFKVLDVSADEATRSFVHTTSKREEFPVIFIAGEPIGGFVELVELDLNGGLKKKVFG